MTEHQLVSAIARVGIATLNKVIGSDRLDRLAELGVPMRPSDLAEAAFREKGYELLRDRTLRKSLLLSLPPKHVRDKLGLPEGELDFNALANFGWGKNPSTKQFLSIFDLSLEDAFPALSKELNFANRTQIPKPLFDYQNSIRRQLHGFVLEKNNGRIITHMPTGSGKTRTTMEFIADFIRTRVAEYPTLVVWMAHSDELCEQAVQSFTDIWSTLGCENANIYRFWGGYSDGDIDYRSGPVFVVTSFQSCYRAINTQNDEKFSIMMKMRAECDLLVVDEAHMSTAPTYRQAIDSLCNQGTFIIGLTATPGRHHIGNDAAETEELARFYEGNKITFGDDITGGVNPVEFLQGRGILSRLTRYQIQSGVDLVLSQKEERAVSDLLDLPSDVLRKLGENAKRTTIVATHALALAIEQQKSTIIFCPSKENAVDLALLLQSKGCRTRAVTGETPINERRDAINGFKNGEIRALTNFGVLTTGFDAPNIEAVIVARPTTSVVLYSQMVGRGLRGAAVGGTNDCTLVDVIDNIKNLPNVRQAFTFFDDYFGDNDANC